MLLIKYKINKNLVIEGKTQTELANQTKRKF